MKENHDNEILTYGFFLRFAKTNYIPCPKCQGRLHEDLMGKKWIISSLPLITLIYNPTKIQSKYVSFGLKFLSAHGDNPPTNGSIVWAPCDICQHYLLKIISKSELILGNKDYTDPPVELWRKWKRKE